LSNTQLEYLAWFRRLFNYADFFYYCIKRYLLLANIPIFPFHLLPTSLLSTVTTGFVSLWEKKFVGMSIKSKNTLPFFPLARKKKKKKKKNVSSNKLFPPAGK
jgi:hypothetical protein